LSWCARGGSFRILCVVSDRRRSKGKEEVVCWKSGSGSKISSYPIVGGHQLHEQGKEMVRLQSGPRPHNNQFLFRSSEGHVHTSPITKELPNLSKVEEGDISFPFPLNKRKNK
jgi:hypothetical protein